MLKDNISEEEHDLLFGGKKKPAVNQMKEYPNEIRLVEQNESLKEEIEHITKTKDIQIAGLTLDIKKLEERLDSVRNRKLIFCLDFEAIHFYFDREYSTEF